MTTTTPITTAEQLLKAGDIGRCELVRGELIMMSPAGYGHGKTIFRLGLRLGAYVDARRLGELCTAETGFVLGRNPDTVRAPDIAFVRAERDLPEGTPGFYEGYPDLAVEVLSPDDTAADILDKIQDYLGAGTLAVWVVNPKTKSVAVYTPDAPVLMLKENDVLTGGNVVPGFEIAVRDVFVPRRSK